ncbi:glycosyltransferase family 9 protein [Thiotrichales bacterium 19S9-12]|nr:glycosyltransferase family 9 protein [Thiotrichales bacterium 19S9-11]MCF6811753.1 glycosyltransferase family 9 protein [Thiotrichales bacterium 19S9-12]
MKSTIKRLKNGIIIPFVKCLQTFKKTNLYDDKKPNILLVCTTALGDNIWSTPFFEKIKSISNHAKISYLTNNLGQAVTENNPYIDQVFNINTMNKIKLYKQLKQQKFQAVFIFHATDRFIYPLCALLKAQYFVGIRNEVKQLEALFTHLVDSNNEHPVIVRNRMLEITKLSSPSDKLALILYPQPKNFKLAKAYILKKKLNDRLIIGIHPGSSQIRKQWPTEKFKQLVTLLHQNYPNCIFLITGSKKEQTLIESFKPLNSNIVCLDESFDIMTLTALLSSIDLYITNDTGPMHIASAMNVPIVAISKLDNNTWPYNQSPKAIITCGEKHRHPIPKDSAEYIHRVEIDDIFKAATNLLHDIINEKTR